MVRIPKRLCNRWLAKHIKDGLDEYKLEFFIETSYVLGSYEDLGDDILLFALSFKKKSGRPMRALLWVRKRGLDDFVELILIKGHVEELK